MGFLTHLFYPWGLILQAIALVHFFRRRPDTFWVFVILFMGALGAAIYIVAEMIPDAGMISGQGSKFLARRRRRVELERAAATNPSAGNLEDLGIVLMESGRLAEARGLFDRAIAQRADSLDAFYRRGVCTLELGDAASAVPDLARVVDAQPGYDFDRAAGLLAKAYALTGRHAEAESLFRQVTARSTLSETYLNFAELLAADGRTTEARQWAQRVLEKRRQMLSYQRRRERRWFRAASALLRRLPMA